MQKKFHIFYQWWLSTLLGNTETLALGWALDRVAFCIAPRCPGSSKQGWALSAVIMDCNAREFSFRWKKKLISKLFFLFLSIFVSQIQEVLVEKVKICPWALMEKWNEVIRPMIAKENLFIILHHMRQHSFLRMAILQIRRTVIHLEGMTAKDTSTTYRTDMPR